MLSPVSVGITTQQSYVIACCVLSPQDYLFSCYVLLTTMAEKGRGVGYGQERDEEILFLKRNIHELMIKDMQRYITELTHQLEKRNLQEQGWEESYHGSLLIGKFAFFFQL